MGLLTLALPPGSPALNSAYSKRCRFVTETLVAPAFVASLSRAGIPPGRVAGSLVRPLLGVAALVAAGLGARATLDGDVWVLLAGGGGGLAAYVACVVPLPRLARWLRPARPAPLPAEATREPSAA